MSKLNSIAGATIVAAISASTLLLLPVVSRAAITSYPITIPLSTLFRVNVGGSDSMTTASPTERNQFASTSDGVIFYVPRDNIGGTGPLYRLYNGADHMDSEYQGEGGYNTEGVLAYPWNSGTTLPGLVEITRARNGGDHGTFQPAELYPPGFCCGEGFAKWGFPRYGNAAENILSLSAGGVTIESNLVAGGSIWRWWWNGTEFVNNFDFGREIQSSLAYTDNSNVEHAPTEAGDTYSTVDNSGLHAPVRQPADRHGSPVTLAQNNGSTQTTQSIPLEFTPELSGGGPNNPVLFQDIRFEKDITLNYNNMGPVAEYITHLYTPISLNNATFEAPTGYLRGAFNRYWTYDAAADTLSEIPSPSCSAKMGFHPNFGGVIISNTSMGRAMGVYAVNRSVSGGSISDTIMFNFNCTPSDPNTESSWNTAKWTALVGPITINPGWTEYHSWIVSADLATVRQLMRQLYLANVR